MAPSDSPSPAAMNAPETPLRFDAAINAAADRVEAKVVAWRRDLHEYPELGNREVRTWRRSVGKRRRPL